MNFRLRLQAVYRHAWPTQPTPDYAIPDYQRDFTAEQYPGMVMGTDGNRPAAVRAAIAEAARIRTLVESDPVARQQDIQAYISDDGPRPLGEGNPPPFSFYEPLY